MKDKIEKFILVTNLLSVFLVSMGITIILLSTGLLFIPIHLGVPFVIITGFLSAVIITTLIWIVRKSWKFWEYAEFIQDKAEKAETKDEIESIYKNHFIKLQSMSFGKPHSSKLLEIHTILKVKHHLLK